MLQVIKDSKITDSLNISFVEKFFPKKWVLLFKQYLLIVLTLFCNKLYLMIIDVLARNYRFPRLSRYHLFVFRHSMIYLTLNMVFMPALSFAVGSILNSKLDSLYSMVLETKNFNFFNLAQNFYLINAGSFFINLVLQISSFIFLLELTRFGELLSALGSVKVAVLFRTQIREQKYKLKESLSFRIGIKYAEASSIIIMMCVIGYPNSNLASSAHSYYFLVHYTLFCDCLGIHL